MTLTFFDYAGITVTAILAVILVLLLLRQRKISLENKQKAALERQRLYQISSS